MQAAKGSKAGKKRPQGRLTRKDYKAGIKGVKGRQPKTTRQVRQESKARKESKAARQERKDSKAGKKRLKGGQEKT